MGRGLLLVVAVSVGVAACSLERASQDYALEESVEDYTWPADVPLPEFTPEHNDRDRPLPPPAPSLEEKLQQVQDDAHAQLAELVELSSVICRVRFISSSEVAESLVLTASVGPETLIVHHAAVEVLETYEGSVPGDLSIRFVPTGDLRRLPAEFYAFLQSAGQDSTTHQLLAAYPLQDGAVQLGLDSVPQSDFEGMLP